MYLTLIPMSLADLVLAYLTLLDSVCKLPFLKSSTINQSIHHVFNPYQNYSQKFKLTLH